MVKRDAFQFDPNLDPWERQPGEPKAAHLYFFMGLQEPVRQRTVKLVSEKAGISALRAYQYSSLYHWSDRWEAFDRVKFGHWFADLAADRMLVAHEFAEQLKLSMEVTGQTLAKLRDEPGALLPPELVSAMRTNILVFKAIYGAAPETVHHSGPGGGPVALDFSELDQLTPEELAARVKQLTGQDLPADYGGSAPSA